MPVLERVAAPFRLLAKAARNASVQLICHDPLIPGSTLQRNRPQPTLGNPAQQPPIYTVPEPSRTNSRSLCNSKGGDNRSRSKPSSNEDGPEFNAYLCSQGPRALESLPIEEHRKHYNDSKAWKMKMLGPLQGNEKLEQPYAPNKEKPVEYAALGRAVEDPPRTKTPGLEEFRCDWMRVCDKYGSKAIQYPHPLPPPPPPQLQPHVNFSLKVLNSDDSMGQSQTDLETQNSSTHSSESCIGDLSGTTKGATKYTSNLSVELGNRNMITKWSKTGLVTPASAERSSGENGYPTPPLSTETSPSDLPSLASRATVRTVSSENSIAPFAPRLQVLKKPSKFALYPPNHRLGFDCICTVCEERRRKINGTSNVPTLFERRIAVSKSRTLNNTESCARKSRVPPDGVLTPTSSESDQCIDKAGGRGALQRAPISSDVPPHRKYPKVVEGYYPPCVIDLTTPVDANFGFGADILAGNFASGSDRLEVIGYPSDAQSKLVKVLGKRGREEFEKGQIYMAEEHDMNIDEIENDSNMKRQRRK